VVLVKLDQFFLSRGTWLWSGYLDLIRLLCTVASGRSGFRKGVTIHRHRQMHA